MVLIIIILLASYIVAPLVDLCLNERTRVPVKIAVYLITLAYVLWALFVGRAI